MAYTTLNKMVTVFINNDVIRTAKADQHQSYAMWHVSYAASIPCILCRSGSICCMFGLVADYFSVIDEAPAFAQPASACVISYLYSTCRVFLFILSVVF